MSVLLKLVSNGPLIGVDFAVVVCGIKSLNYFVTKQFVEKLYGKH